MTQPAAKQVGDAACRRSCGQARATVRQVASRQPDRRQAGRATPAALAARVSLALYWGASADLPVWGRLSAGGQKIGRASCRARVCQYEYISVVAGCLKKNIIKITEKKG